MAACRKTQVVCWARHDRAHHANCDHCKRVHQHIRCADLLDLRVRATSEAPTTRPSSYGAFNFNSD